MISGQILFEFASASFSLYKNLKKCALFEVALKVKFNLVTTSKMTSELRSNTLVFCNRDD